MLVQIKQTLDIRATARSKEKEILEYWFYNTNETILRKLLPEESKIYPDSEIFLKICDSKFKTLSLNERQRFKSRYEEIEDRM